MNPPLYDKVHQLSIDIVNASSAKNTNAQWNTYNKLQELCILNENTRNDHPIQWEALADFTNNNEQAITIYQKALQCSESLSLNEYSASISLAMAERHHYIQKVELALKLAGDANELAKTTNNLDLRKEISEFLLSATNST